MARSQGAIPGRRFPTVTRSETRPVTHPGRGDDMALGLTDPLTALSFSAMPAAELAEHHRGLLAAQREVDHWRRLITARIDLAVASVADLEEPRSFQLITYLTPGCPPAGLRDLLGIARL